MTTYLDDPPNGGETLEQRLRRLGVVKDSTPDKAPPKAETLAERQKRLGISADASANPDPGRINTGRVDTRTGKERLVGLGAQVVDAATLNSLAELSWLFGWRDRKAAYDATQGILDEQRRLDPAGTMFARGVGMAGTIIPSVAASGVPTAVGAGLGLRPASLVAPTLGRELATGAGLGGYVGLMEDGSLSDRLKNGVVSAGVGVGLPLMFKGATNLFGMIPGTQRLASRISPAMGATGKAADEVAGAYQADAATGWRSVPADPSVPPLGIDQGGANVTALVGSAARAPGQAKAIIGDALVTRQNAMRPAVTNALETGTGVTKAAADDVAVGIARQNQELAASEAAIKEQQSLLNVAAQDANKFALAETKKAQGLLDTQAAEANAARNPVTAWESEAGPIQDGVVRLQQQIADKSEVGNRMFGVARRESNDVILDNPVIESLRKTPMGQLAEKDAERLMGANAPTIKKDARFAGFTPEQTQQQIALMKSRGMSVPDEAMMEGEIIPAMNPEKLHLMKRWYSVRARYGQRFGLSTTEQAQAAKAVEEIDAIRGEMPQAWKDADAAVAEKWRLIDASNLGRQAANATNEASTNKAALTKTATSFEQRAAKLPPDERAAFIDQLRISLGEKFRGMSPDAVAKALSDPNGPMARMVKLSGVDPSAVARRLVKVEVPTLPKPTPRTAPSLPLPEKSPVLAATERGRNILTAWNDANGKGEASGLPLLLSDRLTMTPEAQDALRVGAASGLRHGWEDVSTSIKSPGRFFAESPTREAQVGLAFPSQSKADEFLGSVKAWDNVVKQKGEVLGGSPTQKFASMDASRAEGAAGKLVEGAAMAGMNKLAYGMYRIKAGLKDLSRMNVAAQNAEIARLTVVNRDLGEALAIAQKRGLLRTRGSRARLGLSLLSRDLGESSIKQTNGLFGALP